MAALAEEAAKTSPVNGHRRVDDGGGVVAGVVRRAVQEADADVGVVVDPATKPIEELVRSPSEVVVCCLNGDVEEGHAQVAVVVVVVVVRCGWVGVQGRRCARRP